MFFNLSAVNHHKPFLLGVFFIEIHREKEGRTDNKQISRVALDGCECQSAVTGGDAGREKSSMGDVRKCDPGSRNREHNAPGQRQACVPVGEQKDPGVAGAQPA